MSQMSFGDAEYAGKRKKTRRELFLEEMDQVVPWKSLPALIEPELLVGLGNGVGQLGGVGRVLAVHLDVNEHRVANRAQIEAAPQQAQRFLGLEFLSIIVFLAPLGV